MKFNTLILQNLSF